MHKFDDIIPPSRRKESESSDTQPLAKRSVRSSRGPSRFPRITMGVTFLIIVGSIAALFYFSSAKIEVVPSTISATVQSSFTATQNSTTLPFTIITAQKVASQGVKGSGTKNVSSSASGTITIYNTQPKPQQLVTNTRFATTGGLVFRIHSAVTIPGGSSSKPGSVTAKVYADHPGSTYNVGPTSFSVPGFAGTPQAAMVYARSLEAMVGGASGLTPIVDGTTEAQTRRALIAALESDLTASITAQIPAGYVLLRGAATTTYEALASTPSSSSGMVDIKEQGTLRAVVFPNASLGKVIASSISGINYQGEPLTVATTTSLTLVATSGLPQSETNPFTFTLSGTAPLIYSVDTSRIATAVAGKTRSAAEVALTSYPEVSQAVMILRPFWKQTFPEDPAAITVVVTSP